jgi:hypothetical protein
MLSVSLHDSTDRRFRSSRSHARGTAISWPAANLRTANAPKLAGYGFHLSFGEGTHNGALWERLLDMGQDFVARFARARTEFPDRIDSR